MCNSLIYVCVVQYTGVTDSRSVRPRPRTLYCFCSTTFLVSKVGPLLIHNRNNFRRSHELIERNFTAKHWRSLGVRSPLIAEVCPQTSLSPFSSWDSCEGKQLCGGYVNVQKLTVSPERCPFFDCGLKSEKSPLSQIVWLRSCCYV